MIITLDGRCMTNREDAHEYLQQMLQLPSHYGKNLDALYDCLTEIHTPVQILLEHCQLLDSYGKRIMNTMQDAANNNPALTFEKKDC